MDRFGQNPVRSGNTHGCADSGLPVRHLCRPGPPAAFSVLGGLAVLTIILSLVIASAWLWFDMKSMPSIERYGWQGWYLVGVPGAYAASVLLLVGWVLLALFRVAKR